MSKLKHNINSHEFDISSHVKIPSLDPEEVERLVNVNASNFGISDVMYIPDPDTHEFIRIDKNKPSKKAIKILKKLLEILKEIK